MIKFTKKTIITIEALLDISHSLNGALVRSIDLAKRHNVQIRYLEQVLQALVNNSILKAYRGSSGGYCLSRPMSEITLADIVQIVDSLDKSRRSLELVADSKLSYPIFKKLLDSANVDTMAKLKKITLKTLSDSETFYLVESYSQEDLSNFTI